jgi:hypothetical protein
MSIALRLLVLPLLIVAMLSGKPTSYPRIVKYRYAEAQADAKKLQTGWYVVVDSSKFKRVHTRKSSSHFLDWVPLCIVGDFTAENIYANKQGSFEMSFTLSEYALKAWKSSCYEDIGMKVAFVLNDQLIDIVKVDKEVKNGLIVLKENAYTEEELKAIKHAIEKEKKLYLSDE